MTEFICSDTNVWIDFNAIDAAALPFLLPCTYIMWEEAVENEILAPANLKNTLLELGLVAVRITGEEFYLADKLSDCYSKLTSYDAVALAIAKQRNILLLTGDGRLRKAAEQEGVAVIGTIGVIDKLLLSGKLDKNEYRSAVAKLLEMNGGVVRLPENELLARLSV